MQHTAPMQRPGCLQAHDALCTRPGMKMKHVHCEIDMRQRWGVPRLRRGGSGQQRACSEN